MTKTHLMKNYILKMVQSLYIAEIYRFWQPHCTKLKNGLLTEFITEIFFRGFFFSLELKTEQ